MLIKQYTKFNEPIIKVSENFDFSHALSKTNIIQDDTYN